MASWDKDRGRDDSRPRKGGGSRDIYRDGTVWPAPESLRHDLDPALQGEDRRQLKRRALVESLHDHRRGLDAIAGELERAPAARIRRALIELDAVIAAVTGRVD